MSRTKPVFPLTTRNLSSSKSLKIDWQEFKSRCVGTEADLHNYDKDPDGCSTLCSPSGSSLSKSLLQCGFLYHFQITAAPLFISRSQSRQYCQQSQIRIFPSPTRALRSSCESLFQLRQRRSHMSLPGYACSH